MLNALINFNKPYYKVLLLRDQNRCKIIPNFYGKFQACTKKALKWLNNQIVSHLIRDVGTKVFAYSILHKTTGNVKNTFAEL